MDNETTGAAERVAAYLDHRDTTNLSAATIHWFYPQDQPCIELEASDLRALLAENARLKATARTVRAAFHVNMLRAYPGKSHEEIGAEIDKALGRIVEAQPACKTCGGSKVDPGGLPVCRDCTTAQPAIASVPPVATVPDKNAIAIHALDQLTNGSKYDLTDSPLSFMANVKRILASTKEPK